MTPDNYDVVYYFNIEDLPKRAQDLLEALEDAGVISIVHHCVVVDVHKINRISELRSNTHLTKRRLEAAECVANGLTYKEGAARMCIRLGTFKHTMSEMFDATGIQGSAHLVARLLEAGMIKLWTKEENKHA